MRIGAPLAIGVIAVLMISGCTRGEDAPTTIPDESSPGITDTTLLLGVSSPLSGSNAAAGSCAVAGLTTYLEAKNADGGFEFGDGKTRTVTLKYLDDRNDPDAAVANFRQLVDVDKIFAYVGALGTSTNVAIMPLANDEQVPQVLLLSAAAGFSSDQAARPWSGGLLPTYYDEGRAFGDLLVARGEEISVASLAQNDGYGDDYLAGFVDAIEGSDVKIVSSATYEPTDTVLTSRVTELAASGADVLLSAVSVASLQVSVLTTARSVGWTPEVFLPSNTSTPDSVVIPGNGAAFPAVYTSSVTKVPGSAAVSNDNDVLDYQAAFQKYGAAITNTFTPHCAWSYVEGAVLEQAFVGMTQPTRSAFLDALHSIDGFAAPLLLDGVTVDTTDPTRSAIHDVTVVQFNGTGYSPLSGD